MGVIVGIVGVMVGATVGIKVGIAGATVGVKVGASVHHIAAGKAAPGTGSVGATVGKSAAVGQNEIPPKVVGTVGTKGRVGAAMGVTPGASVAGVGNARNGGKITAKTYDDTKLKTVIKNKLMNKSLSDLI